MPRRGSRRPSAAENRTNWDGRVLLAHQVSKNWTLPGGRVEHAEDPFDAVTGRSLRRPAATRLRSTEIFNPVFEMLYAPYREAQ
jgi:8-oxo-dGTP pyrophosphatase MutT (NUDIX family)